jgi:hypothetical protein
MKALEVGATFKEHVFGRAGRGAVGIRRTKIKIKQAEV